VVLTGSLDADDLGYDADATASRRAGQSSEAAPFFHRGPGYARLAGGATEAEFDRL
jgi:N-methylhydantoinase B